MIGSVEELKAEMTKAVEAGVMEQDIFADFTVGDMSEANYEKIDLHKNVVDRIVLVSETGRPMKRGPIFLSALRDKMLCTFVFLKIMSFLLW